MLNDIFGSLCELLQSWPSDFNEAIMKLEEFFDTFSYYFDLFKTFLSYIYFFIIPEPLLILIGCVFVVIIIRFIMAIVNLLWP